MKKKSRYCPSCGLKTNDSKCIICGRATKSMVHRFEEKELFLVADDIVTVEDVEVRAESQKMRKQGKEKNKALFEQYGKHPESIVDKKNKSTVQNTKKKSKGILKKVIWVYLIVFLSAYLLTFMVEGFTNFIDELDFSAVEEILDSNRDVEDIRSNIWDEIDFYYDYESIDDLLAIDTSQKYATIRNKTNMVIECSAGTNTWINLYPYEETDVYLSEEIEELEVDYVLDYRNKVNLEYRVHEISEGRYEILLSGALNESEYWDLARSIMASGIVLGEYDRVELKFVNADTKEKYEEATLDFGALTIRILDIEEEFKLD